MTSFTRLVLIMLATGAFFAALSFILTRDVEDAELFAIGWVVGMFVGYHLPDAFKHWLGRWSSW